MENIILGFFVVKSMGLAGKKRRRQGMFEGFYNLFVT